MAIQKKADKINLRFLQVASGILCLFGLILSLYAFHVETKKEQDENYTAMCDISEHMSCTAAFSSKYGKGFGLLQHFVGEDSILIKPNSVYGAMFYLSFMPIAEVPNLTMGKFLVFMALISNLVSVYLAYILLFVLYDFCIVCVTTYAINLLLLISSMYRYQYHLMNLSKDSRKKAN